MSFVGSKTNISYLRERLEYQDDRYIRFLWLVQNRSEMIGNTRVIRRVHGRKLVSTSYYQLIARIYRTTILWSVLTSLQPPFLQGSPSDISSFASNKLGAVLLHTTGGLSEGALDAMSWIKGVLAKAGLSALQVGCGARCFIWPVLRVNVFWSKGFGAANTEADFALLPLIILPFFVKSYLSLSRLFLWVVPQGTGHPFSP